MRIIQLIQKPQARGAEIFTCQLSTALENLGHQVLLISLFEGKYKLPYEGSLVDLNLARNRRLWDLSSWKKLAKVITDFSPDIVQANGADTLKYAVFARKFSKGGFQLIFNNGGVVSHYIDSWLKRVYNQYLFGEVDALVSVSSYSQKDLDGFISKPKPHQVIPIGIECKENILLKEPSSFQVFVHIAGFTAEKNHRGLLRIFERFLIKQPTAELWLIGDGPLRKTIAGLVRNSSYSNQVRFLGAIPNPFSQIPSNSVLVLPSIIEGLPAVILEALQYQVPVFAYGVGGIPDLLKDELIDFKVNPGQEVTFVERVEKYLGMDIERKKKILEDAKTWVGQNFQISQVACKYEAYYKSLCV